MLARRAALLASISLGALVVGCQTTGSGVTPERTPEERAAIGEDLESRLLAIRPQPPIFGVRDDLLPEERAAVAAFVATLPSGRLIYGGNPVYWIDIEVVPHLDPGTLSHLRYDVRLRRTDTHEVVGQPVSEGNYCMDSEAVITYPIRCALLRPRLLRRALEQL